MNAYNLTISRILHLTTAFALLHSTCNAQIAVSHHLEEANKEWNSYMQKIRSAHPSLTVFFSLRPDALRDYGVLVVPANARMLSIEKIEWGMRSYSRGQHHHFMDFTARNFSKNIRLPNYLPEHYLDLKTLWQAPRLFSGMSEKDRVPQTRHLDRLTVSTDVGTRKSIEKRANNVPLSVIQSEISTRSINPSGFGLPEQGFGFTEQQLQQMELKPRAIKPPADETEMADPSAIVGQYTELLHTKRRLEQDRFRQRQRVEQELILHAGRATENLTRHIERAISQQRKAIRVYGYRASNSDDARPLATSATAALNSLDVASVKRACDDANSEAMKYFDKSFEDNIKSVTKEIVGVAAILDQIARNHGISRTDLIQRYTR